MKSTITKLFIGIFAFSLVFTSCFKDDLLREIDDLRTLVVTLQQKNDSLNKVINLRADSLAKALTASQKRSDSLAVVLRTKTDSLSQALGITNTNLLNMGKSIDSIKSQLTGINTQLTQLSSQLATTNSQIAALTLQLASANADIVALNTKYQQLTTQLQNINAQIAALQAEQAKQLDKLNAILLILNPPADITTGLVAYYPFSGNAGDSSGYGNHGTVIGATPAADRFGIANRSYFFDGSNAYITISPSISNSNIKGAATFSSWLNSNNGNNYFICKSNSTTGDYRLFTSSSYFRLVVDSKEYSLNYNFPINQWFHIAATYFNGIVSLYVNGILVGSTSVVFNNYPATNANTNLEIGRDPWGLNEFHQGKIDDIRIYTRALTQQDITYLASH